MIADQASFEHLSSPAQVYRLRRAALTALEQYPIDVDRIRLLYHGFNTTFRVDVADGRRFALRINVNSRKTIANLHAEMAWLAALALDTELPVPEPQPTRDGALHTNVFMAGLGRELPVAMLSWLPGRDVEDPSVESMRALGRLTATLHEHATTWSLPPGAELPGIDTVLMGLPYRLDIDHPLLTPERRDVFDAALARVQSHYDALLAGQPRIALHADLHGGNLKWLRGRLSVFDFDDAGIGAPAQDLAISAYYLRDEMELEAALIEGYQEVRSLPAFTSEQFEAVVASRNIVLANDVVTTTNAEMRAMLPRYVPNTVTKLRRYLETGVYRHEVPGLV